MVINSVKFTNAFDAITDDKVEANELQFRADLMVVLREILNEKGWRKDDAAKELKLSQMRVRDLLKGKIDTFTIGFLMTCLLRVGFRFKPKYEYGILSIEVQKEFNTIRQRA